MTVSDLPALNATLNATAAALLLIGWACIRRRRVAAHRAAMLAACAVSALFLVSYVVYHAHAGSKPYGGTGLLRGIYFAVLIPHIVLAAAIVPLVAVTLVRALQEKFDRHARVARWTLPLWLYVSATGVIIYLMLY